MKFELPRFFWGKKKKSAEEAEGVPKIKVDPEVNGEVGAPVRHERY